MNVFACPETRVITTAEMPLTRELHIIRAHHLHYTSLLDDFRKHVIFIRDTHTLPWHHSKSIMHRECENLLTECKRLKGELHMQERRVKNVMGLVFSSLNILDSRRMRKVKEAAARDSAEVKYILLAAFRMNISELDPGAIATLPIFIAIVISFTIITVWLIMTIQSPYRLGWPMHLYRNMAKKKALRQHYRRHPRAQLEYFLQSFTVCSTRINLRDSIIAFPIQNAPILSLPRGAFEDFRGVYYALADASLFRNAFKCAPYRFSTRVIVFVDEPIGFEDSKSLLIKVFVKSIARVVVKALAPHIARCQVSSSLPHITQFSGKATKLRTLRMKCRIADTDEDMRLVSRQTLLSQPKPFLCPRLQCLDMHGHIFVEALRIPQWEESIRQLSQKELTISHIRGFAANEFDLRALITAISKMGHLTRLKLSNIELDITSCLSRPARTIYIKFFPSWDLVLEDIDAEEDLIEFINLWDGFSVHLKNCPGLDDRFLQRLAMINPCNDCFYAQTLRQLNFKIPSPSSSISVDALKQLVLTRMELSASPGAPELSLEDKIWFQERIECFLWDTAPPRTCASPIIEGDCMEWDFSTVIIYRCSDSPSTQLMESQELSCSSPALTAIDDSDESSSTTSQSFVIYDDYCGPGWSQADLLCV
ncbi:hypothetical protein BJ912DRAFT_971936 [Pholiota molesta]|nr:hypothetical protein BJ912DRAFT_971936 [Pholiota molesta]